MTGDQHRRNSGGGGGGGGGHRPPERKLLTQPPLTIENLPTRIRNGINGNVRLLPPKFMDGSTCGGDNSCFMPPLSRGGCRPHPHPPQYPGCYPPPPMCGPPSMCGPPMCYPPPCPPMFCCPPPYYCPYPTMPPPNCCPPPPCPPPPCCPCPGRSKKGAAAGGSSCCGSGSTVVQVPKGRRPNYSKSYGKDTSTSCPPCAPELPFQASPDQGSSLTYPSPSPGGAPITMNFNMTPPPGQGPDVHGRPYNYPPGGSVTNNVTILPPGSCYQQGQGGQGFMCQPNQSQSQDQCQGTYDPCAGWSSHRGSQTHDETPLPVKSHRSSQTLHEEEDYQDDVRDSMMSTSYDERRDSNEEYSHGSRRDSNASTSSNYHQTTQTQHPRYESQMSTDYPQSHKSPVVHRYDSQTSHTPRPVNSYHYHPGMPDNVSTFSRAPTPIHHPVVTQVRDSRRGSASSVQSHMSYAHTPKNLPSMDPSVNMHGYHPLSSRRGSMDSVASSRHPKDYSDLGKDYVKDFLDHNSRRGSMESVRSVKGHGHRTGSLESNTGSVKVSGPYEAIKSHSAPDLNVVHNDVRVVSHKDKELAQTQGPNMVPVYRTTTQTQMQIVQRPDQPSEVVVIKKPVLELAGYAPEEHDENDNDRGKHDRCKDGRKPRIPPHDYHGHPIPCPLRIRDPCALPKLITSDCRPIKKKKGVANPFSVRPPICPIRETIASILQKKPPVNCKWHERDVPQFHDYCKAKLKKKDHHDDHSGHSHGRGKESSEPPSSRGGYSHSHNTEDSSKDRRGVKRRLNQR